MAINVGSLIVNGKTTTVAEIDEASNIKPQRLTVPSSIEEGTVIHNGQPKKFNKKMSAYMIDMLTSED